ncbi:MAG: hypothetical protein ACRCXD_13205 [Luteolibacter sp.]
MKSALLFAAFLIPATALAQSRSWMNAEGRIIEAELVTAGETHVSLKLKDAKIVSVAVASLSPVDRAFVRSRVKADALAARRTPIEKRVWPDLVQVHSSEIERLELVTTDQPGFIYRSPSFEFGSEARLLPALIKEVARTFESTKRLIEALPWGIDCRPPEGMERYLAALYETRASYVAAGGPENSGGVYMSGDKTFRIPFESLGIKRLGQSYTRDADFSNDTLVHEITHQLMHDYLPFLPMWAIEGTAEFTEMMPFKSGTFRVGDHEKGVKEYLGGGARRVSVKLPKLNELFRMTRAEWHQQSEQTEPGEISRQHELYRQSALLVYYFNFLDGDLGKRGHRWMRFMDAVREESQRWQIYHRDAAEFLKKQETFLKLPGVRKLGDGRIEYPTSLTPPLPPISPDGAGRAYSDQTPLKHLGLLLDARSEAEVEREMTAKFAEIGIKPGS